MAARQEELETQLDRLIAASAGCVEEEYLPKRFNKEKRKEAVEQVEQLAQAIHPFKLPVELEWFWSTWEANSFAQVMGSPGFISPKLALEFWKQEIADPEIALPGSRSLIKVAYEGHTFAAVELDYLDSSYPLLWGGAFESEGTKPWAPDLASWVGARASVIGTRQEVLNMFESSMDEAEFAVLCRESLIAEGYDPDLLVRYRTQEDWPERWKTQQNLPKLDWM